MVYLSDCCHDFFTATENHLIQIGQLLEKHEKNPQN